MKISEIIATINLSDHKIDDGLSFIDLIDINEYEFDYTRCEEDGSLTRVTIGQHYCTDTQVGVNLYFLHDNPVAITFQSARKSDVDIRFFTKQDFNNLKTYLLGFVEDEEEFELIDIGEDIGPGYPVAYSQEIIGNPKLKMVETGETVDIIAKAANNDINDWSNITICRENGDIEKVSMNDVVLPWGAY